MTRFARVARPVALSLVLALAAVQPVAAQSVAHTMVPIGSGYAADTLERFASAAAGHASDGTVDIVVLPITYGLDPYTSSRKDTKKNLDLADTRRGQLEDACNAVKQANQNCSVVLAPILVRDDAYLQSNLDLFVPGLDGMFVLGGDQTVAMKVVANTPTEQKMAQAYANGAVIGGNSAGAAVESLTMIAGYVGNNGPETGLRQGSVDLWAPDGTSTDDTRGLSFGVANVLLDQHVLQRGRIGRLLNASFTSGLLGIGADAETAATIVNEQSLTDVSGRSAAVVIDAHTYGATGGFAGPTNSLYLRNVATHVLPAGDFGYDIAGQQPISNGAALRAPILAGRSFRALTLPADAGSLLLGGDISGDKAGLVAQRFVAASGGNAARIVVLAAGYAKSSTARADAKDYAAAFASLGAGQVAWYVLDNKADQAAIATEMGQASGIFLTAPDQATVLPALQAAAPVVAAAQDLWLSQGVTIMADNAAASALGELMTTTPPPPSDTAGLEDASIASFRPDSVSVVGGLGWVPGIAVEPRLVLDRQWGQVYNVLVRNKTILALGIDVGTAVELTPGAATAWGTSAALTFDGRYGKFGTGSNGALSAQWVILDSFVDGQNVVP